MPYQADLQSAFHHLVQAGEAGRTHIDSMTGPINGAVGDITGAVAELSSFPGVSSEEGAMLQRMLRALQGAQSQVGNVLSTYSAAARALSGIEERMGAFSEQAAKAKALINPLAGNISPRLSNIISTGLGTTPSSLAAAVKPFPHLLILQPLRGSAQPYYFNLDTAAFEELRRQTEFRWASQERLSRRPAQQAVGQGEDKLTLKGAIYPGHKGGLKQLDTLRSIGSQLVPLNLTTGYGVVLGTWCLRSLEEEQSALMLGGVPRKQSFSLEFSRYGDDLQNI